MVSARIVPDEIMRGIVVDGARNYLIGNIVCIDE